MPTFSAPKGTKDIQADQFYARQHIASLILRVLEKYGFRQVMTPAFENIEVLKAKAGEAIIEQIYEFRDKGDRHLGLRSDITASVARLIAPQSKALSKPIKISSYDRLWRYERPQSGRFREFFQINAELFGTSNPISDAELIACFCECYDAVGLTDYKIHIGHRRLLEDFIRTLGVDKGSLLPVIRAVDKAPKLTEEEFRAEVIEAGLPHEALSKLQTFTTFKGQIGPMMEKAGQVYSSHDILRPSLEELSSIVQMLRVYGVDERCILDLAIARGSDYYTGIIFECVYNTQLVGSIGGGGRYDNLIEVYGGPSMPAIGFSVGFDRVMILLNALDKFDAPSFIPPLDYYMMYADSCLEDAIHITQQLRQQNRTVEIDLLTRDLKGQLAQAAKMGAALAVIVSPDGLAQNRVVVRDMKTRSEQSVEIDQLVRREN